MMGWGTVAHGFLLIPFVVFGLVYCRRRLTGKRVGRGRVPLIVASLVPPVVSMAFLYFTNNQDIDLIEHQLIAAAVLTLPLGVFLLTALVALILKRRRLLAEGRPAVKLFFFSICAPLFAVFFLHEGYVQPRAAIIDALYPRENVQGVIDRFERPRYGLKGHVFAGKILVAGQWYEVTTDIAPQLHAGALLNAEAGAGSHYILALKNTVP